MKQRIIFMLIGILLLSLNGTTIASANEAKKILYFDLATRFDHEPTVIQNDGVTFGGKLITQFANELGYDVKCTKDGSVFERDLSPYVAVVFYTCDDLTETKPRQIPLTPTGEKNLLEAIHNGMGFLGLHSTVWNWGSKGPADKKDSPFNKMLGAQVIIHGSQQETNVFLTEPIELPSLKQQNKKVIQYFEEWYALTDFNDDIHVILVQDTKNMNKEGINQCYDRPSYPCTWIRQEGRGRVAYTSVGHDISKLSSEFSSGITRDLLAFVVGQLNLDLTPNIKQVCPNVTLLQTESN